MHAVLLATAAVWSTLGIAQTTKSDGKALLEREQAVLSQQIAAKQQQIATLRERPSPEQAELAEALKTLNDARAAHKAKGNADTEAKLKNAEFKYTLAERKFNKANADIDTLNNELEQLRQQLAATRQQARSAPSGEAQNAAAGQQRLAEERARRQEQELQRTRQEAESQQREIERLKALLAAKEAAAKTAPAQPAAAAAPAPVPAPAANAAAASEGLHKLSSRQEVVQSLQQLEQRLSGLSLRARGGVNEVLYLKPKNRTATNKDRITLRALGLEQYRGEAQIEPGSYELVLGFKRWPLQFGDAERGTFVFLYDNSDAQKPQLVLYDSALENGAH